MNIKEIFVMAKKYYCEHPFDKTIKVLQLIIKDKEIYDFNDSFIYTVNIRQCAYCGKYFIDEGYCPESARDKKNIIL